MSYQIRDYSALRHTNKYRYSYSLSMSRDNKFSTSGEDKYSVGSRTTDLTSQKLVFSIYSHYVF